MKLTARTMLEALTGAWSKYPLLAENTNSLLGLPPELQALAEKAKMRDEFLERLTEKV